MVAAGTLAEVAAAERFSPALAVVETRVVLADLCAAAGAAIRRQPATMVSQGHVREVAAAAAESAHNPFLVSRFTEVWAITVVEVEEGLMTAATADSAAAAVPGVTLETAATAGSAAAAAPVLSVSLPVDREKAVLEAASEERWTAAGARALAAPSSTRTEGL